jgi:cytochrome d ubiquinol oxidase subunit I
MDSILLARLQFGITTVYHFFFVPLTLGLTILVAVLQTMYVVKKDEKYKAMAQFWGKLMLINFAMGVVTGIVQEFQFGMNWSEYSRFVGDIFGAPLAIEALAAFFIESTFLGVWIFGWDKLSKGWHLTSIWLVAFASNLSACWILIANAFMQNPVGYKIAASGRAEMTDFLAVITNPHALLEIPHVVLGGLTTAAFFMAGISAFHLLRAKRADLASFRFSIRLAFGVGVAAVLATMLFGHAQGQQMANNQPMKLASSEGIWQAEDPAGLSMFQIGNEADRSSIINIRIPSLLSLLSYNSPSGKVQGLNDLQAAYVAKYGPGNYIPPAIWLTYWSFRAMVGAGVLMFMLALVAIFQLSSRSLETKRNRWLLYLFVPAILLPYLANSSGWILSEFGRQPWIVQGLMTIDKAVSPNVTPAMLLITLIGYTLLYAALMVADVYLLQKTARDDGKGNLITWFASSKTTKKISPKRAR